jgi:hypothetical protein
MSTETWDAYRKGARSYTTRCFDCGFVGRHGLLEIVACGRHPEAEQVPWSHQEARDAEYVRRLAETGMDVDEMVAEVGQASAYWSGTTPARIAVAYSRLDRWGLLPIPQGAPVGGPNKLFGRGT